MKTHRTTSFLKFTKDGLNEVDETIAVESSLELWLEDMHLASFIYTSGYEREICLGYLITSGIISDISDIEFVDVAEHQCVITSKRRSQFIQSFLVERTANHTDIPPLPTNIEAEPVNLETLREIVDNLQNNQILHSKTGTVHSAMLVDQKTDTIKMIEDIGRHNALDKVVGYFSLKGVPLSGCLLFVSGRLTSEMVSKAANARIPFMGSLALATDLGIQIASNVGITLLGSLKKDEFWLYNQGSIKPFQF